MRSIVTALLALVVVAGALAQDRGGAPRGGAQPFGPATGFGNILFPGTGSAPVPMVRPFSGRGEFGGRGRGGFVPVPYAIPIYVGWYPYPPPAQPNITIVMPPAPAAGEAPPPSADSSPLQFYQAPRVSNTTEDQGVVFLIALKDGSVYSAVAYWAAGETLHYVTPQGKHNQVSLGLVDRGVSSKLNQGRRVEFALPPAK